MNAQRYFLKLCFLDGDRDGAVRCEDGEGKYIAYRISKERFAGIRREKRTDEVLRYVENYGIYFLIYEDARGEIKSVYVGKAGERANKRIGLLNRIVEHQRDPKLREWQEVVMLTTKENAWGPTELNYLENGFYQIVKECGFSANRNGNTPPGSKPSDEVKHILDGLLEKHSRDIISAMGLAILNPRKSRPKAKSSVAKDGKQSLPDALNLQRKKPFAFSAVKIPIGATLQFTEGTQQVIVEDDKHVTYGGKSYSLTGFVREFIPNKNKSGAYQGPKYFMYNGRLLSDLRT